MRQALLFGIGSSTLNLVIVVVQTSDVSTGELCNLPGRSSNTTANVKNSVSILDANFGSEVVLVAGNGLVEPLSIGETAEMEGLAPAILVEIGCEVVVTRCC